MLPSGVSSRHLSGNLPRPMGPKEGGRGAGHARGGYRQAIHGRYRAAARREKGRILDEFCRVTGYHRKYALRRLNGPPPGSGPPRRRPRAVSYGPEVIQALRVIWEAAGYPWSVRLKALL